MVIAASYLFAFLAVTSATVTLKSPHADKKTLSTISLSGVPCASIADVCEALGGRTRPDTASQKLMCVKGTRKIVFSENVPFYCVNDSVRQMPCCPIRRDESLFLPAWLCAEAFSGFDNDGIEWNAGDSVLTARAAPAKSVKASKARENESDNAEETATAREIIKTIVIDPGHGGKDPGAIGSDGTQEKDIVLSIALQLRDALKKKAPDALSDA